MNISEAIVPPAQREGVKANAHEITPSGHKPRICSHLLRVDAFLNFKSSESKMESFGPSNIVTMFLLNDGACFNRPFAKRSPREVCARSLCASLSFHARSARDFINTRISSSTFFAAFEKRMLKSLKTSPLAIGWVYFR